MGTGKKVLIGIVVVFVGMQFFRIDKTNPSVDINKDFIVMTNPDEEVQNILNVACYDCHSNTTSYPWYTNIAPVSWWLKHHIDEGREELNFSNWGDYNEKRSDHKLEECIELVKEGEMPLSSYTWTHGEAKLSHEQRVKLTTFFQSLRK